MNGVFADAQYWVALLHEKDQSHAAAEAASRLLQGMRIVTTEEVLTEVLAYFSERGRFIRQVAAAYVADIVGDPAIIVRPQSHQSFTDGLAFYQSRPDKGYSLTDCISMLTMRQEGITGVLSQDGHFAQEGFTLLI